MRTTKRYTNQTFTKHVDDEKGRHRTLRNANNARPPIANGSQVNSRKSLSSN